AGLTQGLMWRAFDETGSLAYPQFIETVSQLQPFYIARALGGTLFLLGALFCVVNMLLTWMDRPKTYETPVHRAPALAKTYQDHEQPHSRLSANIELGHKGDVFLQGAWHRRWERLPLRFTLFVLIAISIASLFEIIPTFLIKSNVPTIASVRPYTPLELAGRDIYIAEGCYNCHSQMIRPIFAETARYGEYSKPGEFVYDHPFQWGSRRIGPDLAREGGRQSNLWHVTHFLDPAQMTPGSIMPKYSWLVTQDLDYASIPARVGAMAMLGVPYGDAVEHAEDLARAQAQVIADDIESQGGPADLETKKVVAMIAYLQRLGTDLYATPPAADDVSGDEATDDGADAAAPGANDRGPDAGHDAGQDAGGAG
ncbi:MAG: cytochrome-c oxidase, cbb3-type subunit II, partial [Phycisphaerales bacterium]|nr:cytochrome-c oxidase, cbb3-type subunit II [Phycisphaerales bacterium]